MTPDAARALAEAERAKGRTVVFVHEDGDQFVAEWEGVEYRWGNPFGLDGLLTTAGVPAPRSLIFVDDEGGQER